MSLSQQILDAARDEVAREMQYPNWFAFRGSEKFRRGPWVFDKRAFDKAMEKQAEFYEWLSSMGYVYGEPYWKIPYVRGKEGTLLELYDIWRKEKKNV